MLFTIERRQPHPSGQKVGPIGRDTSRNRLDGVDPRPAAPVDSFDPLIVRPDPRKQVREFTREGRVALPQFVSERVTLGWRDWRTSGRLRVSNGRLLLCSQVAESDSRRLSHADRISSARVRPAQLRSRIASSCRTAWPSLCLPFIVYF